MLGTAIRILISTILVSSWWPAGASGDELTLEISGETLELTGEILIEAQDSSLYFRENNGKIWFVKPSQIRQKTDTDDPVPPMSKKAIGKQLLKELPKGFRIYETTHYVIAFQNELAYARWIGGLYEAKLYRAFETFWKRKKKFQLSKPKYPLVAIIFGTKAEYQRYVERELGPGQTMVAYYNIQNNRVAMYDLTVGNLPPGASVNDRKIEQVLQNPGAINMVATVIHEGTHQLIFNRGIQRRFSDQPLWVNEGLAMYFEAPDLRSKRGWQKPGLIFEQRFVRFADYARRRPNDSLRTLITDDKRLQNEATVLDGYAEAWAFNHFLLNRHSKEYTEYLKHLAAKQPLVRTSAETRLADFQQFFGEDLATLDAEFIKYMQRLR